VAGWDEVAQAVVVGDGAARFDELRVRLLGWRFHERAGLRVRDRPPRVLPGATARLRVPWLPWVEAPVRVWSVIDEPGRAGFTCTTLPGHPVEGVEELFLDLADSGQVTFTVRSRARPALWWTRALPWATRAVQRIIVRRYLSAAAARV